MWAEEGKGGAKGRGETIWGGGWFGFRRDNHGLFSFQSPPRDGCPNGVVRWRETWSRKVRESSDCFTKVRESSRKFAQIRPVNPRLFGLLQGRPIFRREFREFRELARIIDARDGREGRRMGLAWTAGRESVGPFTNRMASRCNSSLNTAKGLK